MDNELLLSVQEGLDIATPIYTIGVAANLLNIHPRTLQLYEAEGLISPGYNGFRRLFSQADIHWARCLTSMIYEAGISLPSVKRLLEFTACWEIIDCQGEIRQLCKTKKRRAMPCAVSSKINAGDGFFAKGFLPNISAN
jgi:MerR family transcriptional regulator/heat shock protein HspR